MPPERQYLIDLWQDRKRLWCCLLLLGLVFGAFLPVINNGFVNFDDPDYVTTNWRVQRGLSWEDVTWAFTSSRAANWHPLTWVSHMADCEFFGLEAWGHHFTSLLLHAFNTMLAFLAFQRLTGATGRSLVVALIFGLHPLRVESVAWVAERKDVLSTTFWMLTVWAYAAYASRPSTLAPRRSSLLYSLALVFFILGLLAKPMLVTLPCVLLLLDYWPLRRFDSGTGKHELKSLFPLVREKIPFFVVSVAACAVTFLVQERGGAVTHTLSLPVRLANAAVSYCRYLRKLIWPADLAFFYPQVGHWPASAVVAALLLLLAVSWVGFRSRHQYPWLLVGWLWFVGTLVPVIGLVPVGMQSMADRYSYIPSIGVLLIVTWGAYELTRRWRYQAHAAVVLSAVAVLCCITLTRAQVGCWRDDETLCRHAISVTSDNYLAHNNLGTALDKQGRLEEAVREFQEVLREQPDNAEAHNNWGYVLNKQGRPQEALKECEQALRLRPTYATAYNNLGLALGQVGRSDDALNAFRAALKLDPDSAETHCNFGIALGEKGRLDEAIQELEAALRLNPADLDALNNLGVTLDRKGLIDAAITQYARAIRLKPDFARAHFNLGVAMGRKGQVDAAINEFQVVLQLKPDYGPAQTNLALALEQKKQQNPAPAPK